MAHKAIIPRMFAKTIILFTFIYKNGVSPPLLPSAMLYCRKTFTSYDPIVGLLHIQFMHIVSFVEIYFFVMVDTFFQRACIPSITSADGYISWVKVK